ncbi:ribosomal protein L7/L12 [Allokutzneria sp. NRRL B-24872]|uniref:ribosomal protein L7/L12 n=1 Tax=Allokutzneria sp. NRRL B-24872 TaxID=1137961 RepID=UPI00143DAB35|nr:ribosomal protein L7/L12 [Allokutzneria sp. NRRL B-24872]
MEIVEDGCDEFDVVLLDVPAARTPVLKIVREATGWSIAEAREKIENAPVLLVEATSKQRADELKRRLTEVGATAEVHGSA